MNIVSDFLIRNYFINENCPSLSICHVYYCFITLFTFTLSRHVVYFFNIVCHQLQCIT